MFRTVLIVDAEPAVLRILVLVLHEIGCATLTALNVDQARTLMETELGNPEPALCAAVIDGDLPGAVKLIDSLKDGGGSASIPVLVTSIYGRPAGHRADRFLPKPFQPDEVVAFIRDRAIGD